MMLSTRRATKLRGWIISRLTDDIALHVFSFLELRVLWCMLQVSKRMSRLASEDVLWHSLLLNEIGAWTCRSKIARHADAKPWLATSGRGPCLPSSVSSTRN